MLVINLYHSRKKNLTSRSAIGVAVARCRRAGKIDIKNLCGFSFFVYFRVSLRVHGSAFAGFHQVPFTVWQVSLATGRLTNSPTLLLYTGPVYRVIWPGFRFKVPERESNSSYTAKVDPFPSALSTRPTLIPLGWVGHWISYTKCKLIW